MPRMFRSKGLGGQNLICLLNSSDLIELFSVEIGPQGRDRIFVLLCEGGVMRTEVATLQHPLFQFKN